VLFVEESGMKTMVECGMASKAMCLVIAVMALFSTTTAFAEVRIVALGDSSIRGVGVSSDQTYPAQLEAALRARGHQVTVTNQGVNSDTATGVLQRLESAVPPGTDIVVLKIGERERKFNHASLETVIANKRTIRERLHAKGVEVYTLLNMGQGLTSRGDLLVESYCSWNIACHLNPAGLAIVVRRTLPAIEALVSKVEKHGACRPQCWNQTFPPVRAALMR
jgi:hypothetical protein